MIICLTYCSVNLQCVVSSFSYILVNGKTLDTYLQGYYCWTHWRPESWQAKNVKNYSLDKTVTIGFHFPLVSLPLSYVYFVCSVELGTRTELAVCLLVYSYCSNCRLNWTGHQLGKLRVEEGGVFLDFKIEQGNNCWVNFRCVVYNLP